MSEFTEVLYLVNPIRTKVRIKSDKQKNVAKLLADWLEKMKDRKSDEKAKLGHRRVTNS